MSTSNRTQQTRVYVPEEVGDLYNILTAEAARRESVDPDQVPFFKYKDVFLLAACLGYQLQRRIPLPKGDKKREIRLDTFNENDIDILKAIAIAESDDIEILMNMGEVLKIAEEYAYVGIKELDVRLLKSGGHPLWNLISLIHSESQIFPTESN